MKSKTTRDNPCIDTESEVAFELKFDKTQKLEAHQFLQEDCVDTYEALVSKKWSSLTPQQQRLVGGKEAFLQNKNFAITLLLSMYDSAYELIKKDLTKQKRQIIQERRKKIRILEEKDI